MPAAAASLSINVVSFVVVCMQVCNMYILPQYTHIYIHTLKRCVRVNCSCVRGSFFSLFPAFENPIM